MTEEQSVEEYIRQEFKKMYDKTFLETVTGPDIYGPGNFEVYLENDRWEIRPVEGWKPAVLLGIVTDYPMVTLNRIRDYLKENDPEILKALDDRSYMVFQHLNDQPFTWDGHIEEWKESWMKENPSYLERMKKKSTFVLFPSTKEEAVAIVEDIPTCPDCVQGKHSNCNGLSWNNTEDHLTSCPCYDNNHSEAVEWDIDANLPMYTRDYLKSKDSNPKASEVLFAEVKWLLTALENASDDNYSITYRDGFAAAITWVEFHAKQAKEKE